MPQLENNIPAYPHITQDNADRVLTVENPGMTLLDHFAGLVMQAYCVGCNDYKATAHFAYEQAAAMLEQRKNYID